MDMPLNTWRTIDFIGIAHFCGPLKDKVLKNGTVKPIRHIQLADESGKVIQLGIWGEFAPKLDLGVDEHPVVALKRVQLSDYSGRSLNSNEDS